MLPNRSAVTVTTTPSFHIKFTNPLSPFLLFFSLWFAYNASLSFTEASPSLLLAASRLRPLFAAVVRCGEFAVISSLFPCPMMLGMSQSTKAGELFAAVHGSRRVGLSPTTALSLPLPSNLSCPDSIQRSRFTRTPSPVVLQIDPYNYLMSTHSPMCKSRIHLFLLKA